MSFGFRLTLGSAFFAAALGGVNLMPQEEIKASTGERLILDLNGNWDMAVTDTPQYPPRPAAWKNAVIPMMEESNAVRGTRFVWYRRQVKIPDAPEDRRIVLVLYGARFNATVYCNGSEIDSRLEGFTPWDVDLTGRVKPGANLQLEIRCQDWSAVFKDGYTLPPDADPDGEKLRGLPRGRLLAPIGGHFGWYGIWDDVALHVMPAAHCANVAIQTSVRNNNLLSLSGEVTGGRPGLWIEGAVYNGPNLILNLKGRELGKDLKFNLSAVFPSPRYWSPEDPHLYSLSLTLKYSSRGIPLDRYEERFGFRELWAVGPDFYLNGVKRHLLASSGWPETRYQSEREIRRAIIDIKASNAVAFRLHTQPWQRKWLELADEVGLMIVEEGALWCDGGGGYAYADDRFWKNVGTHLAGMVKRDRNRASLVMWSLENELLHCGAARYCACAEEKLAQAGRMVKALDQTHLITFEADHDPGGAADVIGLHYPREMPENIDYPNTTDWLGDTVTTGTAGGTAGSWNKDFLWDRKKPLYIGEYLWVFQRDYSPGSVFFGDDAYRDLNKYKDMAKAMAWEMQTIAYRRAGVSGLCPWTIADNGGRIDRESSLFQAQKRAYTPVAVFPRQLDARFFLREKVTRTFDVFNDGPRPLKMELRLSFPGWAGGQTERFTLEPGGRKLITSTIPLPGTPAPGGLKFNAELFTAGKKVHSYQTLFHIYEKQPLPVPPGKRLMIFDPSGKWLETTDRAAVKELKGLEGLPDLDPLKTILIIAPQAFTEKKTEAAIPVIGRDYPAALGFRGFLQKGGRALVLEQNTLAEIMPELALVDHSATMTFPVSNAHPLLIGLGPRDFKFWRGDNRVSNKEIRRPARLNAQPVLVSGGLEALDQTPLLEITVGSGKVVFCQALAGAKYRLEPAARRLIHNAIRSLAAPQKPAFPAWLQVDGADGAQFEKRLAELGVATVPFPEQLQPGELEKSGLIILHGGGDKINRLAPLFQNRAAGHRPLTVYWHAPEASSFDKLKPFFGLESAVIVPAAGPLTLLEADAPGRGGIQADVLTGVLKEDVTFFKPAKTDNWYREIDPDPSVIDRALGRQTSEARMNRYEIETWSLAGDLVGRGADGRSVAYHTNGSAIGEIKVTGAGLYHLSLEAWGTPAGGGWPLVLVKANGDTVAQVSVTAGKKQAVSFFARLPSGTVKIELSFTNDLYKNNEDRNLWIDALLVAQEPDELRGISLFSLPPALAGAVTSSGLRLVLDGVRWDLTETNRLKGLRFAGALLSRLGAAGDSPAVVSDWIGPPFFQPNGTSAAFQRTDTVLSLASAGSVETAFSCAADGEYSVSIRGYSSPAQGVYAIARVGIDGRAIGETELDSSTDKIFFTGTVALSAGNHLLTVEFLNDLWLGPGKEDRNLYLTGIGFSQKELSP